MRVRGLGALCRRVPSYVGGRALWGSPQRHGGPTSVRIGELAAGRLRSIAQASSSSLFFI